MLALFNYIFKQIIALRYVNPTKNYDELWTL